jgi:hypothetical protein
MYMAVPIFMVSLNLVKILKSFLLVNIYPDLDYMICREVHQAASSSITLLSKLFQLLRR